MSLKHQNNTYTQVHTYTLIHNYNTDTNATNKITTE